MVRPEVPVHDISKVGAEKAFKKALSMTKVHDSEYDKPSGIFREKNYTVGLIPQHPKGKPGLNEGKILDVGKNNKNSIAQLIRDEIKRTGEPEGIYFESRGLVVGPEGNLVVEPVVGRMFPFGEVKRDIETVGERGKGMHGRGAEKTVFEKRR